MSHASVHEQLWRIEANRARVQLPGFTATVHVDDPARGLADLQIAGVTQSDFTPLAVQLAGGAPNEVYARGTDLIVTYADRPAANVRTQVYWRARGGDVPGLLAAIELMVSVQTSLLDSTPTLWTSSRLPECDVDRLGDSTHLNGTLFRPRGANFSYAEMVHPSDASRSELVPGNSGLQLRHALFAERLEKGVILRSRVLGLWVERTADEQLVGEQFAAWSVSDPPLTT